MKLRDYREKHGLTPEDIASRSGISRQTVWLIETGNGTSLDTALRIIRATNGEVTAEDLESEKQRRELGGESEPVKP
jgi:DNA-binding XRE family transcriptional regulator